MNKHFSGGGAIVFGVLGAIIGETFYRSPVIGGVCGAVLGLLIEIANNTARKD
jgi:hypothetical protein